MTAVRAVNESALGLNLAADTDAGANGAAPMRPATKAAMCFGFMNSPSGNKVANVRRTERRSPGARPRELRHQRLLRKEHAGPRSDAEVSFVTSMVHLGTKHQCDATGLWSIDART